MKVNTEILKDIVYSKGEEMEHPVLMTCSITMNPYELKKSLGAKIAKRIWPEYNEDGFDGEDEEVEIFSFELDMHQSAYCADCYEHRGYLAYVNAKYAFRDETLNISEAPCILLTVCLNEKISFKELKPVYLDILDQINRELKVAKVLINTTTGFINRVNTFIAVPCEDELHLKIGQDLLTNVRFEINEISEELMNVSLFKEEEFLN